MAYGYVKPSSVHTPATGQTAPATWGTAVNNASDWLAPAAAIIRRVAAQSVGDSSDNFISFDTEDLDDAAFFTTDDPTKITIPRHGMYLFDISAEFASDADGIRLVQPYRNGVLDGGGIYFPAINGVNTAVRFTFMTAQRSSTDYYQVNVWHNAGGALDVTARLGVTLLQERSS